MTTPSAALSDAPATREAPTQPCECGPIGLAWLLNSEAFKRGAASVRELDARELNAAGRFGEADKQLRLATELRK